MPLEAMMPPSCVMARMAKRMLCDFVQPRCLEKRSRRRSSSSSTITCSGFMRRTYHDVTLHTIMTQSPCGIPDKMTTSVTAVMSAPPTTTKSTPEGPLGSDGARMRSKRRWHPPQGPAKRRRRECASNAPPSSSSPRLDPLGSARCTRRACSGSASRSCRAQSRGTRRGFGLARPTRCESHPDAPRCRGRHIRTTEPRGGSGRTKGGRASMVQDCSSRESNADTLSACD